jgi:chromosome segregation ATPase
MSFSAAHLADGKAQDESTIRQQLFMKTSEAKRWQDSVLHLSGIATSKDEALSVERSRSAKLQLALEDAQEVAAAHKNECEKLHKDRHVAMQQVTMLQSELQTILGTCSGLENQVTQLGALSQLLSPLLHCHASRAVSSARAHACSHARKHKRAKWYRKLAATRT